MDNVLQQHQAAQAAKPVFEFDLPPELILLEDKWVKRSMGFIKLELDAELKALELARNDPAKAGVYMVIASLVEVDGRRLDKANGEDESVVRHTDPAIRSLMLSAHTDISGTTKGQEQVFLKSRRIKVG